MYCAGASAIPRVVGINLLIRLVAWCLISLTKVGPLVVTVSTPPIALRLQLNLKRTHTEIPPSERVEYIDQRRFKLYRRELVCTIEYNTKETRKTRGRL